MGYYFENDHEKEPCAADNGKKMSGNSWSAFVPPAGQGSDDLGLRGKCELFHYGLVWLFGHE